VRRTRGVTRILAVLASMLVLCSGAFPADTGELERRALDAMARGHYEKATRLLEESLRSRPNDPGTLYNLACCLSRTDELEAAGKRLEAAWEAGLRDIELLRADPDLDNLRASKRGGALVERLIVEEQRRRRLRGAPQFFEAPMLGTMRVVPPRRMEPGRSYPLIMILHGHGANPANYAGFFETAGAELDAIVCAPYGPYHIVHQDWHGYSWYPEPWLWREVLSSGGPSEDPAARRATIDGLEQQVTQRHVLAAIDSIADAYPVDEDQVFLVGHSEGGGVAYGLGLAKPDRFKGVVVVGARLPTADATPENLANAAGKLNVLICHSRQDERVSFAHAKAAHKTLSAEGIESRLSVYTGGHGMTEPLARAIDRWIRGL